MATTAVLFVGTYTQKEDHVDGKGKGIYSFTLDLATGALTPLALTENVGVNPSFIAGSSTTLYAVNEVAQKSASADDKTTTGYIKALAIEKGGKLRLLNSLETKGAYPCHVALSPSGAFVTAANYGGGSLSMFPVKEDGSLAEASDFHAFPGSSGAVPARQEASHLHSTKWIAHADGSEALLAADLGNDFVAQFVLDASSKSLTANASVPFAKRPPGSGPRHIAIHSALQVAYVSDELSSMVGVHPIDKTTGALSAQEIQKISMLPADFTGQNLAADIHVSTCGKFLYASNRGHDSLAIYRIDASNGGQLELVGFESTRGKAPRAFLIHESFLFAANQNTDTIEVFAIDADTGKLTFTGHNVVCPTPVSLVVVPSN